MRVPIVCVDSRVRQYATAFVDCFSRPQFRHFVTVLAALLLWRGPRTLTGLLRTVQGKTTRASLSRFLSEAPWDATALAGGGASTGNSRRAWPNSMPSSVPLAPNDAVVPRHPS